MSDVVFVEVENQVWFKSVRSYSKLLVSLLSSSVVTCLVAVSEGVTDTLTVMTAVVSVVSVLSVYGVTNTPVSGKTVVDTKPGDTVAVIPVTMSVREVVTPAGQPNVTVIVPVDSATPDGVTRNGGM